MPTADEAVLLYEQDGGTLTPFGDFGVDPLGELDDEGKRQERVRIFAQRFSSLEPLFHRLVNGDSSLFKEATCPYAGFWRGCSSELRVELS